MEKEKTKEYHNFWTIGKRCPNCGELEFRPLLIGNDRDGWNSYGDWECDSCGLEVNTNSLLAEV